MSAILSWETLFYCSVVLLVAEHLLQDYFFLFHYRCGWKLHSRDSTVVWDPDTVIKGKNQVSKLAAYRFVKDGNICLFRYKHTLFIPFIPFFYFRGLAELHKGKVLVSVRLHLEILVFLLLGVAWLVSSGNWIVDLAYGCTASFVVFLLLKSFALSSFDAYYEEIVASLKK